MLYAAALLLLPAILASTSAIDPRTVGVDVHAGVCLRLKADAALQATALGLAADAAVKVAACVCAEADVSLDLLSGRSLLDLDVDVDVYVQLAAGAEASVGRQVGAGQGKAVKALALANANLGSVCKVPFTLFANSHYDFTQGCCVRTCNAGFRPNGNPLFPACVPICTGNKPIFFTKSTGQSVCVEVCDANELRNPTSGNCYCPQPASYRNGVCTYPPCPSTQTRQPTLNMQCGCNPGTQALCGNTCINTATQTCASGIPRSLTKRSRHACPVGKTYCPAVGHDGWECIDTMTDIESCGGCADPSNPFGVNGIGADCTSIPGINAVSCHRGECRVHSCQAGWAFAADGTCAPAGLGGSEANRTQQGLVIAAHLS